MAEFRKCVPVLAVLALLLGSAVTASAQPQPAFSCFANAGVPPIVRAEGITELVGDVLLNCTGGVPTAPGAPIPEVNIQIFLNTPVTSKVLTGTLTEALLLLDDPGPSNANNPTQDPCLSAPLPCRDASGLQFNKGNGQGQGIYGLPYYTGQAGGGTNRNVFQGEVAPGRNDSILWRGVPIDPPGTNGTRIIRITNVRSYAGFLGTGTVPVPITMDLTATGTFSVPINNPRQTVAVIQKGLAFSVRNAPTAFQQCFSQSYARAATLRYDELFPTAFKKYNVGSSDASPTTAIDQNTFLPSLNTETGFLHKDSQTNNPAFPSTNGLNAAGLPSFGTRLKAVFNNVPSGVSLYVALTALSSTASDPTRARLVTSESGGYTAASAAGTSGTAATVGAVSLTGGSGTAVWEVTESDAVTFARLDFDVYISYTANPGANSPAIGPTATVNGSFAPISTTTTATSGPIPRFADTSTATNIFSINPCVTNLLFPFVTNQLGFDTGLAIASTSTDPFGTSPQSGTCSLYWYGANPPTPNPTVTPTVASGTVFTTLASLTAPNFQGYMIAVCRFQYGHGFAFVSDVGARNLAMGYLALVIPDPARTPAPFPCITGVGTISSICTYSGEQLGQ